MAELFAGVGGFRLGLDGYDDSRHPEFHMDPAGPYHTVWANQWEPDGKPTRQFAWECYEQRFGQGSCVNEDITVVLDKVQRGEADIPEFDMLVGGFPCQDYSVARTLSSAGGITGRKGVLWWQIRRLLEMRHPKYVLLENVDRLLKSPARQRGRDFAIILSCLDQLGYQTEWRVINAADYGMPQRRRRTYMFAQQGRPQWDPESRLAENGVMARAFPASFDMKINEGGGTESAAGRPERVAVSHDLLEITDRFGIGARTSPFKEAGVMTGGMAFTMKPEPVYDGPETTLGDILIPDSEVPSSYIIPDSQIGKWEYLKGAKRERRVTASGHEWTYSEGSMAFPDSRDKPSRTILTDEGGSGPSRTKHAVRMADGRIRRLVPDELDRLQMFPRGWTDTGMSDNKRAFCMGNALVTGIPHRIGKIIAEDTGSATA